METSRVVVILFAFFVALHAAPVQQAVNVPNADSKTPIDQKEASVENELQELSKIAPMKIEKEPEMKSSEETEVKLPEISETESKQIEPVSQEELHSSEESDELSDDLEITEDMPLLPQDGLLDPDVDLSPRAVAEYLMVTGDFQGFEDAIQDIVRTQLMSPEQVQQYRDAVGYEYEELFQKMSRNEYLQEVAEEQLTEPAVQLRSFGMAEPEEEDIDVDEMLKQLQLRTMLQRENTIDQLLESMVEDYLTQQKAQEQGLNMDDAELQRIIDMMGEDLGNEPIPSEKDEVLPPKQAEDMVPESSGEDVQPRPQEKEGKEEKEEVVEEKQKPDVAEELEKTVSAQSSDKDQSHSEKSE